MTYIGRAGCGCVRFAQVDTPDRRRYVAKEVAAAMRSGLDIERHATEAVRTMKWTKPECATHGKGPEASW